MLPDLHFRWKLHGRGFSKRIGSNRTDSDGECVQSWDEPLPDHAVHHYTTGNVHQCSGICGKCDFPLKETSVFSAISLMDLMFTAKDLIGLYYKTTESLFLLVVFYLILLLPISILGSLLERRLRYAGFGA